VHRRAVDAPAGTARNRSGRRASIPILRVFRQLRRRQYGKSLPTCLSGKPIFQSCAIAYATKYCCETIDGWGQRQDERADLVQIGTTSLAVGPPSPRRKGGAFPARADDGRQSMTLFTAAIHGTGFHCNTGFFAARPARPWGGVTPPGGAVF
jgi:hypothetical protein